MVVVGADVHKRSHTFVAVDEVGRMLGEKTVTATSAGHTAASSGPASSSALSCCGVSKIAAICRRAGT